MFDRARETLNELKGYSNLAGVKFETIALYQGYLKLWYKANVKRESADLKKLGEVLFLIREFDKSYAKNGVNAGKIFESYLLALRAERQKFLKGSLREN